MRAKSFDAHARALADVGCGSTWQIVRTLASEAAAMSNNLGPHRPPMCGPRASEEGAQQTGNHVPCDAHRNIQFRWTAPSRSIGCCGIASHMKKAAGHQVCLVYSMSATCARLKLVDVGSSSSAVQGLVATVGVAPPTLLLLKTLANLRTTECEWRDVDDDRGAEF